MIRTLLLMCMILSASLAAQAETLPERYADSGELILVQLPSAPFPHPKRAEGHTYKNKKFPPAEHYQDPSVGIFIPKGFRRTDQVDFVAHFHGWNNQVEDVLRQFELIQQLLASGRNAVLVVPQGPRNAPDSFGGKLEDPGGFAQLMDDVLKTLREKTSLKGSPVALGKIILSGHSGGYRVIAYILDRGGLTDRVREVWLFDALYAETDKYLAWMDNTPQGRLINIHTEKGGTRKETQAMIATLKQRGTPFFSGKEADLKQQELRTNHWIFIDTDLGHNDVLAKRRQFQDYLRTSCLDEIRR
jgi:hypothetical protein